MVSYIKGEAEVKVIWKREPDANFWGPKGMKMGSREGLTMRNFIVSTVRLIYSEWLNLED